MSRYLVCLALVLVGCSIPDGRFSCSADDECPSGFSCRAMLCWRGGAEPDAGLDGGNVDGGRVDGGRVDGGSVDGGSVRDADATIDGGAPPGCPVPLIAGECVDAIAAGYTTCVIRPGGAVRCWGYNGPESALGDATSIHEVCADELDCSSAPVMVADLGGAAVTLASGERTSCAVVPSAGSSEFVCWGLNPGTGVSPPAPYVVSTPGVPTYVGVRLPLAVIAGGSLYVGGDDAQRRGVWGTGVVPMAPTPTRRVLPSLAGWTLESVSAADVGWYHACAVLESGEGRCWGRNERGELGDGTTTDRSAPVAVMELKGLRHVAAGVSFTCGLVDSNVHCWGTNLLGQLGRSGMGGAPDSSPSGRVTSLTNIVEIEAGLEFACARRADGTVWCWGSDQYGQLGDMVTHSVCADSIPCSSDRVQVQGINNAIDIAAGAHHACALLVTGEVRCWGRNQFGQLGDASLTDRATPVSVLGLD